MRRWLELIAFVSWLTIACVLGLDGQPLAICRRALRSDKVGGRHRPLGPQNIVLSFADFSGTT